jgi:hypothetical protein
VNCVAVLRMSPPILQCSGIRLKLAAMISLAIEQGTPKLKGQAWQLFPRFLGVRGYVLNFPLEMFK